MYPPGEKVSYSAVYFLQTAERAKCKKKLIKNTKTRQVNINKVDVASGLLVGIKSQAHTVV